MNGRSDDNTTKSCYIWLDQTLVALFILPILKHSYFPPPIPSQLARENHSADKRPARGVWL